MDGAMVQEEDVVEAVLTCEGDYHDPELNSRIERFRHRLKDLLLTEKQRLLVKKVEPWNSVKVTFTIPREAAIRLRQLAQTGNDALRQMGVLSVQIQGDTQISLTIAGRNNESTQLVICTPPTSQVGNPSLPLSTDSGIKITEELESSQSSSNDEFTRKNIVHYLRQGSVLRQNQTIFDTILGTGTSSVPVLGFGLDIPKPLDSVPGPSGSNTIFRPNNINTSALQSPALGGALLNSNFPFTTTGAFHPPVPRVPFSAGQRSVTNSTHHTQPGNIGSSRYIGPLGHEPLLNTHPSLSDIGLGGHVFQHNLNSFSPVGAFRNSSSLTSTPVSSMSLHAPRPSSPISSFMIDLPPPPPYPSGSNMSRPGKPAATSSSPLLVNLLQTDPLTAAVGLASGNPNKPMATGELSSNSPIKRKHQSKKTHDGHIKPYLFNDNPTNNRGGTHPRLHSLDLGGLDQSSIKLAEDTIASVDLQSRLSLHQANNLLDTLIPSLTDSRSFFSDHSVNESPSLKELHSDFNRRSAIGSGCNSSSKISESNGPEEFSTELDPFSLEIAAGKIINPYTGQLEPRESFVDGVQVRATDETNNCQVDMLAKKATDMKKVHDNSVPVLPSQMLDSRVWKMSVPTHQINVSTSAAAFVHSDGPLQTSSDKLMSVTSHRRNLVGDGSTRETKEMSFSPSVFSLSGKPWPEADTSSDLAVKISSNTLTNASSRKSSSTVHTSLHKNFTPVPVPFNGPTTGVQSIRHNVSVSHHHIPVSPSSSGIQTAHPGSVMFSSVTKSSSLPLISVSHNSYITQTQSQQSVASTTGIHLSAPSNLQNSVPNISTVSLSMSHTPRLSSISSSSSSSSSQPLLTTERLKPDHSHILNQQSKAASSDKTEERQNNPHNLLKSLPHKHVDPQTNTCSPPENKPSSEGDDNSNHSGLTADTIPEHSGTAALLEHSGVKAENHDSGVGSSSERSDDTPSEPGDNEFRSGQVASEIEDKASLQKTVNCKLDSKMNSNTITVGYMVNPSDSLAQSKLIHLKDSLNTSKTSIVTSVSPAATVADISHFFQTHIMTMDKQAGILTGGSQTSLSKSVDGSKGQSKSGFTGKIRENGLSTDDMDKSASVKLNGPSCQSSIEKMMKTMSELQHKKSRSSPKQNNIKALMDIPTEHLKLQTDVLEKMNKLQQFTECAKDSCDVLTKVNSCDKSESPEALSQCLIDRPDQLLLDLEELVNGKTAGHAGGGTEVKGGSNITSIYSKRSSPVNVNMLNHIYAPGLPLPRRLTESVQRLVKPLPASESSMSYPQVRPCKSPGAGGSPRTGTGLLAQSSPRMSGVRSPGASTPKLLSSDKHSLISGGLDLAGFPNLKNTPVSSDQTDLVTAFVNCKRRSSALPSDVIHQDPQSFSLTQNSPPNLLLDSSYSGKMLSQSFPPHKSRELNPNMTHLNHGLILSLQSNSTVFERGLSPSVHTTHHCQLPQSKAESLQSSTSQDSRCHPSNRSHQDIWQNNHVSSVPDTGQTRPAPQQPTTVDNAHSTNSSHAVETSCAYTSHSNTSSPVMPVLQRGHDPAGGTTIASSMPNISSPSPCFISSLKEISVFNIGSSLPLPDATTPVSSQNKHVPYTNNTVSTLGTTINTTTINTTSINKTAKSSPVSSSVPPFSSASTPSISGMTEDMSNHAAPPRLSLSMSDASLSTKIKRTSNPTTPTPSTRNGSSTPQFSRNLFESVSGTLTRDNIATNRRESVSNNSVDSLSHGGSRLGLLGSDSKSDSINSTVVLSQALKEDPVVRNVRHKSTDGVEKRTTNVVLHSSSKTDTLKSSPSSTFNKHSSLDTSPSTFLSTEVVNLDFSLPPQACNAISLNIGANKVTSKGGNVARTSSSSDGVQESTCLLSKSYTSFSSSISHTKSSSLSCSLDSAPEVSSTVTVGKEESVSKSASGLSMSAPSVKEPILEILASALGSNITNPSMACPGKSFVDKQVPSHSTIIKLQRTEVDTTIEGKMVSIQSSPHKPSSVYKHQVSLEPSDVESTLEQGSDPLLRNLWKKRKSSNSGDEAEGLSLECTPAKQPSYSLEPAATVAKSLVTESDLTQIDFHPKPGDDGVKAIGNTQPKSPCVVLLEMDTEKSASVALETKQEDQDSQGNASKSDSVPVTDSKEQVSSTESRQHRSLTSDFSDESASNRSSSNESRDSAHIISRLPRNIVTSTTESKERRTHRSGASEDKDSAKESRSRLQTDVLENSHKDNRPSRNTSETHDNKDDGMVGHSHRPSSTADDKAKSNKDINADKCSTNLDKTDSKLDDAQKKSHRIKRQFYAYVPEKSIDQTYFDTLILSSRTRSRNKPGTDAPAGPEDAAPVPTGWESQAQPPVVAGTQAATAKVEVTVENTGGKRPVRSVRARDNSQEQSASKRRRVQQQR